MVSLRFASHKAKPAADIAGHLVSARRINRPLAHGRIVHHDLARAIVRGGETYLVGASIHSFQPGNAPEGYDETRTRKLLLSRAEIKYLTGKLESGLTLIPLKVYTHRALVKIELGLGKARKKHDKREVIKKRETERELRRAHS